MLASIRARARVICRQRRAHMASLVDIQPSDGLVGDAANLRCSSRLAGIWNMHFFRHPRGDLNRGGGAAAGGAVATISSLTGCVALRFSNFTSWEDFQLSPNKSFSHRRRIH